MGKQIRITIHSFPINTSQPRIPPIAQVNRWKKQLIDLDTEAVIIKPQAFSGFVGLYFEGTGTYKKTETTVMALSLKLDPEHERALQHSKLKEHEEMLSDITIKAIVPNDLQKHRPALLAFLHSFEFIDEIPRG